MKKGTFAFILALATIAAMAQTPPDAGRGGAGGRGGRGGQNAPAIANLSLRPTGASLGTIRVGAADEKIWFGWRVGIPATDFKQLTFAEAITKSDTLGVTGVEASSSQRIAPEIPKNLDYHLQAGERAAVVRRLREYNQQIWAYRVENIGSDEASERNVLEFAKAINAPMIITDAQPSAISSLDKLAGELGVDVAVEATKDPKAVMAELRGHSKHIGVAADLGGWMQEGIKPVDGLAMVKDRLLAVDIHDRSAIGAKGHDVTLGSGAGALSDFFLAAYRDELKPLFLSVDGTGASDAYADLQKSLNGFERAMWPAMAARVRAMVDSPPGKIRGPELLSAEMRKQIDDGAPRKAIVTPKKPRKLLVTDLQMYSGHATIPHGNLMLELMGKYTGAFTPTFSNDLELLKYPKVKEFDAVWFNNVCGMVHNDPEVREGILRFVREGGGLGGHHAVTFADNNWPEFAELMGGWAGAHHTEKQVIKIDDTGSPLTKSFPAGGFEHTDEFYHFPVYSPYSREKQHILLSLDIQRSDMATAGRLCPECTRPDQDYGLAWIKPYGKGRTYFTPLGHTTPFYTDPMWTQHVLAAVQYILGDLDADATPSGKLAKK
ncbi:MAG TPA: ThuA domain-containing protein [Bryobacteraceae bacterium]|nr:ThuA domain-containing protein [Bryobacteraceae bacterium]